MLRSFDRIFSRSLLCRNLAESQNRITREKSWTAKCIPSKTVCRERPWQTDLACPVCTNTNSWKWNTRVLFASNKARRFQGQSGETNLSPYSLHQKQWSQTDHTQLCENTSISSSNWMQLQSEYLWVESKNKNKIKDEEQEEKEDTN